MTSPVPETPFSQGEAQFDFWRKRIGLFAGPLLAVAIASLPLPLSFEAHSVAALMSGVIVYWMTEAIPLPMTALLAPVVAILLGMGKAEEVLASFGHPILFIFIGTFLIAAAMEKHRLDRHFALWILSFQWVRQRPERLLGTMGMITAFLSMWLSNTATVAMMMPIALGLLAALPQEMRRGNYATGMMLMIAFSASVGGIGTPIGTPPNLIGIGMIAKQTGRTLTFFEWMGLAVPLMIVMFLVLCGLLKFLHLPSYMTNTADQAVPLSVSYREETQWTTGKRNTLLAFSMAILLWVAPGILGLIFGGKAEILKQYHRLLPEGSVAILAATLLFILPTDWSQSEFTLSWEEASGIDWGTILLFGGGLAMGDLMFKSGLAQAIGDGTRAVLQVHSLWAITALAIFLGITVSELASNTASANMVVPVVLAIAGASDVPLIPPALGATLGASYGFMLPISTPPNAMVYGSGLIPIGRMIRAGVIFDILGFFIIWIGLYLLCPLLGLM